MMGMSGMRASLGVHGLVVHGTNLLSEPLTYTPPGHITRYPTGVYSGMPMAEKTHDKRLLDRLNRIEGQVRGISKMVADGRYCIDVLTQIQAVRAALSRVESAMLQEHLGKCIESSITGGDPQDQRAKAAELVQLLDRSR